MEVLSEVLQPYKESVGLAASVVTILQFFSGIMICKDIYQRQSTKGIPALPFVGGIVIGILILKFALILQDKNMFNVNVAAIVLNILYIAFYMAYSENVYEEVGGPAFKGTLLVGALFSYISIEDPALLEYRYGLIVTVLMLGFIAAPLAEVSEIIQKKDSSAIPFPLTFMGLIVSFMWLLYGIILANAFMIIQNIVGVILCLIQVVLCFKYPAKSPIKVD